MTDETPAASRSEIEAELRKQPLLAALSPNAMSDLVTRIVTGQPRKSQNWIASFQVFHEGEALIQQGTYAPEFYVLLGGRVCASRTEPDGEVLVGERLTGSTRINWFGELTSLANQPQPEKVVVEEPSKCLVIQGNGFRMLYEGRGNEGFRKLIDARYREHALALHLRTAPLFKGLRRRDLERIAARAELETLEEGTVIATQGEQADAVYLVRSGIVRCLLRSPGGADRFHAALRDNSSFGERALTGDRRWAASYVAMTRVDLVKLPVMLFAELFGGAGGARSTLEATATTLVEREQGLGSAAAKHLVKAAEVLVIDLHKCTRCNACIEACVAVHDDGVPRISKRGMVDTEHDRMLTSACYHCTSPDCMMSCDFGAIRRTLQGEIEFIYDACTGCKCCERSCPYGVIRMVDLDAGPRPQVQGAAEEAPRRPPSVLSYLPLVGRLFGRRRCEDLLKVGGKQKAIKCDFCAGMPFEACVYSCPCGAIERLDPAQFEVEKAPGS